MVSNMQGNIELTQPRAEYSGHSAEQIQKDYAIMQAGFALANRRLQELDAAP